MEYIGNTSEQMHKGYQIVDYEAGFARVYALYDGAYCLNVYEGQSVEECKRFIDICLANLRQKRRAQKRWGQ